MCLIDATDWDSFYADMGDSRNTMDSYDRGYTDALDRVDDWMDAQPTVDAVEVVHGRWEDVYGGKYANPRYVCSVCKEKSTYTFVRGLLGGYKEMQALTPYCLNCGAMMDGDGNG